MNNNQIAISTPTANAVSVTHLADLARPFGISAATVDGMDVLAVRAATSTALTHIRTGNGPYLLECRSERFSSHSSSTRETRSHEKMMRVQARCPIKSLTHRCKTLGELTIPILEHLEADVAASVAAAFLAAETADYCSVEEALDLVW